MIAKSKALILSLRPEHWVKNGFVFAALIFSGSFLKPSRYVLAGSTFVAFCLGASAAYLINDVVDRRQDRRHPLKCQRPIARGDLGVPTALASATALFAGAVAVSAAVNRATLFALLAYCLLTFAYSLYLKHLPLVDIGVIAAGFVLRAYAGAVAIEVFPSLWLLGCTFVLAVFMGLCKRLHEFDLLGVEGTHHRKTLDFYNRERLVALIVVCACATVAIYGYYTVKPSTVRQVKGPGLALTLPFVIYGVAHYLHLVLRHDGGGRPVQTLLTDWRLLLTVGAWALAAATIVYFGVAP